MYVLWQEIQYKLAWYEYPLNKAVGVGFVPFGVAFP
jgi:hypothetical protein